MQDTKSMARRRALQSSQVGKKALMAVSGLVLVGFVVVHAVANLQMFSGAARINGYAHALRQRPVVLWSARVLLLAAFLVHAGVAVQLSAMKRAARPQTYRSPARYRSRSPARTMLGTGAVLAAFVIIHLANLTWGNLHPHFVPGDVYGNVLALFRAVPARVFYTVAMLALGLHIAHGGWSAWQSLGLNSPAASPRLRRGAWMLAVAVAGSLLCIIGAAATGWLR